MKIIKVDECFQCQHCFKSKIRKSSGTMVSEGEELVCSEAEKIIKDGFKIPKWCPLEDYKEADHENI